MIGLNKGCNAVLRNDFPSTLRTRSQSFFFSKWSIRYRLSCLDRTGYRNLVIVSIQKKDGPNPQRTREYCFLFQKEREREEKNLLGSKKIPKKTHTELSIEKLNRETQLAFLPLHFARFSSSSVVASRFHMVRRYGKYLQRKKKIFEKCDWTNKEADNRNLF